MNFIIYSDKQDLTEGMFGQGLIWLIEILNDLEKKNQITKESKICFDINSLPYDNVIPSFIAPNKQTPKSASSQFEKINVKQYKLKNKIDLDFKEESFILANRIFTEYFNFNDAILNSVINIETNSTIGIHYRGTDKNTDTEQANPISQEFFIKVIDDYLSKNSNIKNIYCCSDEDTFIQNMSIKFMNKYRILSHPQKRAFFRLGNSLEKNRKDDMTIGAITDMLNLSKCQTILKTSSALSAFSKIINPNVEVLTVSAMKQKWFPAGLVKPYKTDSEEINKILKLTMMGHVYQ